MLDGDEVRPHLSAGLGYSREDRDINVHRIGWVARLLACHGVVVLVPVIAPYAAAREAVRADHDAAGVPFAEVFVSTSLEVAETRDVKGLYAKARRGRAHRADRGRRPVRAPGAGRAASSTPPASTWPRRWSAPPTLLAAITVTGPMSPGRARGRTLGPPTAWQLAR